MENAESPTDRNFNVFHVKDTEMLRDHPLTIYAKFSEKLTFLTPL